MKSSEVADLDTKQLNRLATKLDIPSRSKMTQPELREVCKSALVTQESLEQLPLEPQEPQGTTQDEPKATNPVGMRRTSRTPQSLPEAHSEISKKPSSSTTPTTSVASKTVRCKSCSTDLSEHFDDQEFVGKHFGIVRSPKRDGANFIRYFNNCKACCNHRKAHGAYPTKAN
jgi:hypothetical protein